MSYFDTFDHELVGIFGGIPVYHPLEVVEEHNVFGEFGCTPQNIVIGGGSGEHAAIVADSSACTLYYLQYLIETERLPISAGLQHAVDSVPSLDAALRFPGWLISDYAELNTLLASRTFKSVFNSDKFGILERWIAVSLGEFVFLSLPELVQLPPALLQEARSSIARPFIFNVLILPPGYNAPVGRYRDAAGNVVWGNYAWVTRRK